MSAQSLTVIFWVDGRQDPEKVVETSTGAVPRIGDQVQLGSYGGPYEWRRVVDVVWRYNTTERGGISAIVSLSREVEGGREREPVKERGGSKGR